MRWPGSLTWAWGYLGFSVALLALSVPSWCACLILLALILAYFSSHDGGLKWIP